jgi:hypothetical protein
LASGNNDPVNGNRLAAATAPENNKARSRGPRGTRFAVRASVVMAAGAMNMAVREFFLVGATGFHYRRRH